MRQHAVGFNGQPQPWSRDGTQVRSPDRSYLCGDYPIPRILAAAAADFDHLRAGAFNAFPLPMQKMRIILLLSSGQVLSCQTKSQRRRQPCRACTIRSVSTTRLSHRLIFPFAVVGGAREPRNITTGAVYGRCPAMCFIPFGPSCFIICFETCISLVISFIWS